MNKLQIVKVTVDELHELQKISKATFIETFEAVNSTENMTQYLEESLSLKQLTLELKNENSNFYFAKFECEIIGYMKLNIGDAQTELKQENSLEIERIYVLKSFHGHKVGQMLFNEILELAKKNKFDFIWLGVWEENPRAIRFYEKNGFVVFDKHIFKLGEDEQTDLMMKLML